MLACSVLSLLLLAACGERTSDDADAAPAADVESTTGESAPAPDAGVESTTDESAPESAGPAPLVGTVWLLDAVYEPGEGAERRASTVDQVLPAIELIVGPTTATVASGPCTDAVYEVTFTTAENGGSFEVTGGGSVECRGSEGDNANHDVATGGLVSATGYVVDADRLTLVDEEGELIGFIAKG